MRMMNAHIASHLQPLALCDSHHLYAFGARHSAEVNARACFASEQKDGRQGHCLSTNGNRRETEARCDLAVMRDAAARERRILRPQPHREIKSSGVLQRT